MRLALALSMLPMLAACAPEMADPVPTSSYQWERRQEGIERREAERVRLCQMMDKESERYERDCTGAGDPDR